MLGAQPKALADPAGTVQEVHPLSRTGSWRVPSTWSFLDWCSFTYGLSASATRREAARSLVSAQIAKHELANDRGTCCHRLAYIVVVALAYGRQHLRLIRKTRAQQEGQLAHLGLFERVQEIKSPHAWLAVTLCIMDPKGLMNPDPTA